ncbi:MAG: hypothetical protein HDR90_00105, partial [Bacteroides sp.]|nr:hypothetical protein [Bacteroides sp.]
MKRSILSLLLLLWLTAITSVGVHADGAYNPTPTGFKDLVNEPTFESGKFNRNIDCPVSYATGSYSLSVPLFSWDECGYPISISLDYSPGVKAEDQAGMFGLGWSLGGLTGSISRQVTGLPDEKQDFYLLDNKKDLRDYLAEAKPTDLIDLARGIKDAYHDKFYYTITGYSGCFIIKNKTIYDLSENDLTISADWDQNSPSKFTITTPEGWVYKFEGIAKSSKKTKLVQFSSNYVNTDYTVTSLWGLTSVSLPDNVSTINVNSKPNSVTKKEESELFSINVSSNSSSSGTLDILPIDNTITTTRCGFAGINEISASQAKIRFNGFDKSMTGYVTDNKGDTIRRIDLTFDGSIAGRKKLTSIAIYSGDELLDYRLFSYHSDSYSNNRPWACADFFGYSNRNKPFYSDTVKVYFDIIKPGGISDEVGKFYDENKGSHYYYKITDIPVTESILNLNGELNPHRLYNFNHACSASLKEITDANGLTTKIIYEPNVASMRYGSRNDDTVNVNIGIRVRRIETIDTVSGRRKVRSFRYYDPVFSLPINCLRKQDFISHAGVTRPVSNGSLIGGLECSQTTTMTSSCRIPGMSAESTVIYYNAVEETVTGSDIDKAIKTRYEFDNSASVNSSFSISHTSELDNRREKQENAVLYLGCGVSDYTYNNILGINDVGGGFCEVFGQKAPLIRCANYEFDEKKQDFILKEETKNIYTRTEPTEYQVGIYCEQLRRLTKSINNNTGYVYGGDEHDFAKGIAEVKSFRTYLDSTIVIKYFPDGSSRQLATRYLYPDRDSALVKNAFPDEESDIHSGTLHRPVGTIMKCAGTTIAKYDLLSEHLSTHGTRSSSIRTLPVISRTIVNNSKEFTTSVYYSLFNTYPKWYLLPSRYETVGKDGEPIIDWLAVDSYNSRRQPLKVRRMASPTMTYTYQDDGQSLKSIAIDGTSLVKSYTHQPLVGYTSATSPAGNTTYYEYSGSRLSRILDRDRNPIKAYEYHLFSPDDYGHGFIRETTYLAAGAKQPMSARQIFDCYGEQYATIAENASAPNVDIVNFSRLDALSRPVRQYLPFTFTGSDDDLSYQELAVYGDSIARSFYSDRRPYTSTQYFSGSTSTTPAITIDAGSDHDAWRTSVAEMCSNPSKFDLRCIRLEMSGANTLRCLGYWPAGALDVTEVTDPDGARALEFTDFRGLKLLSRRILDGAHLDTYYVYDEWGNLRLALPPEVTLPTGQRSINVTSEQRMLDYAYHYVYDEANRLISKKLPGAEKITYTYDADGRPAFTQDGNMRRDGKAM